MEKKLLTIFLMLLTILFLINHFKSIPIRAEDNVTQFEEWLKEFWRYALKISPEETVEKGNPCLINVPVNISLPIMLLDPFEMGEIKQECILPSNRTILIPAYTGECDTGSELGKSATSEEILTCALDADVGFLDFTLSIDGKKIMDIKDVAVGDHPNIHNFIEVHTTDLFEVEVPEDSEWIDVYNSGPGTYLAHAHGFFAKLDKLSPGKHTLEYTQTISGTRGLMTQSGWSGGDNKVSYDIMIK